MNMIILFWVVLLISLIFSVMFTRKNFKKPDLQEIKLSGYGPALVLLISVLIAQYCLFAFFGKSQLGYIAAIAFVFAAVFSLLAHFSSYFVKENRHFSLRSDFFNAFLTVCFSLAGLALLFALFSHWNPAASVPFLLTSYAFCAALLSLTLNNEQKTHQGIFAFSSLIFTAGMIITGTNVLLLIGAVGLLAGTLSALLAGKKWLLGLLFAHILGAAAILLGSYFFKLSAFILPGMIGLVLSLLFAPVTFFYTESKYRPVKSMVRGKFASVILEISLVPFLLTGIGFLLSYILLPPAERMAGLALAGAAVFIPAAYSTALANASEHAKTLSKAYTVLYASTALILSFAAYHIQIIHLLGSSVIELSSISVLVGLFIGVVLALVTAVCCLNSTSISFVSGICALVAALLLKSEAVAALIAGLAAAGIPLLAGLAIGSAAWQRASKQDFSVNDISGCLSFIAALMLLIAPLLV